MVCSLFWDNDEDELYVTTALDGDIKKIRPVDMTRDEGAIILASRTPQGIKMETAHIPTKLRLGGPRRNLTDIQNPFGVHLVPEAFKEVLERLEPGVHDFYPVELFWKDGSSAGKRYWFYPQHRIDSIDPEKTTYRKKTLWIGAGDATGRLVFSRRAIGDRHAWIEKFLAAGGIVWISERLKQELEAAGITGLGFRPREETD